MQIITLNSHLQTKGKMLQITLLAFIKENILLIGLAIGSGFMLLLPLLNRSASGVANLSATEAVLMLNRGKPLILDVRDTAEFAAGHIQGAKNIPVAELATRLKEIEKFKDKPVLVHCQKGLRARTACNILKAQQFSQLNNLDGGLDKWIETKLPLVKELVKAPTNAKLKPQVIESKKG